MIIKRTYIRKANRLEGYNYSERGIYFITICVKDKIPSFGKCALNKIVLNENGKIAEKYLLEIPSHYINIELDTYIVMPNHIHLILSNGVDPPNEKECPQLHSKIIGSYKNAVTKEIRKNRGQDYFAWQRSFYDHIIRNDKSLEKIRTYIRQNPERWQKQ